MVKMDDTQYRVDSYIVENGFFKADNVKKKELIEAGLKKHMIEIISEIDYTKSIPDEKQSSITPLELAELLGTIIPEEQHDTTIDYLTHYVLGISSYLQGYAIVWEEDNDIALVDSPLVQFNTKGQWDKLITHRNTSHITTFGLATEALDQVIAIKEQRDRQFIKLMTESNNE